MSNTAKLLTLIGAFILTGCATVQSPSGQCLPESPNCPPPGAVDDHELNEWYHLRTWLPPEELEYDPIKLGIQAEIPIQKARVKLLGSDQRDALYSLTAKIYMIEQAEHSIDAVYYIFKSDIAGIAFLGALCNAVQRGVDVRLMVDSLGSISLNKNWLRALDSCQGEATFIHNEVGKLTTRRARIQVFIFNGISRLASNPNRRSHDKLLVIDGFVPEKAMVITGGRNISLDYYGINANGSVNADTYMDAELLLRPGIQSPEDSTVGDVAETYFSLLAGFEHNIHIQSPRPLAGHNRYPSQRAAFVASLMELKSLEPIAASWQAMPEYLNSGYRQTDVLLAHEFANLINKRVVSEAVSNMRGNPNSIMYLMQQGNSENDKHIKIVSPYLFAARYHGAGGEILLDEAQEIKDWLAGDPERTLEIITNSVLTSDNFSAQSIVDMDMAPRILLDEEHLALWQSSRKDSEDNSSLTNSARWRELIQNPRLRIYETGKLDDTLLGGDTNYGKLHAKYMLADDTGFLGTSNFDYRSRLFNNEMGFYLRSKTLTDDMLADFERLKSMSLLWGSTEWLEMRVRLMEQGGIKGLTTQQQRNLFKLLRGTGLDWYF